MQEESLKILSELIKTEPEEPFNRYALAMEYAGKDTVESLRHLEVLLEIFPEYLPTYYQAATLYAEQEKEEKKRKDAKTTMRMQVWSQSEMTTDGDNLHIGI